MKVIVSNDITIYDPTPQLYHWVEERLILNNPDYFKKERMNKWLGNTPQKIYLYESYPDRIVIPFGCLRSLWADFYSKATFETNLHTPIKTEYKSDIKPYPYQEKAIQAILKMKNGVLVMPCGSGKTVCGLEIISRIGGRALWLTHTQDLLNQSKERAKSLLEIDGTYGTITAGKVDVGSHITFATVQTMCKIDLNHMKDLFDIVVCDECMPDNTLIITKKGEKQLQNLLNGDIILSYNRNTCKLEYKKITHIFKNKAHDIVVLKLTNGKEIIATSNHPVYTKRGWIDIADLNGDDYVLQDVWKRNQLDNSFKNELPQEHGKGLGILFKRMLKKSNIDARVQRGEKKEIIGNDETNKREVQRVFQRTFMQKKMYSRTKGNDFKKVKGDRPPSKNKVWKRDGVDSSTTESNDSTCEQKLRSVCGISDTDKNEKRKWLSNLLQDRHSNSRIHDSYRSGRKFTYVIRKTSTRRKEIHILNWVRVDSVTVQEQTSDGTFGGLCPDGYVYNIEVDGNNNYFANGILVHNCQHAAGSPTKVTQFYKVISNLSARYKIGLTATTKRSDGLEQSMFAILGGVVCEIDREEVAHTTCPLHVKLIETGYFPTDDIFNEDGTINYTAITDDLIHDKAREDIIVETLNHLDGSAIVLANRIEYLERLQNQFDGKSVCLSTLGYSKKAKEERKTALAKLGTGELDAVFASYKLASEGLDVPSLRYVVFATPEKFETTVIQSAGRVMRKYEGKPYGTVIDFCDDFGMYRSWERERKKFYKKLNGIIEETEK